MKHLIYIILLISLTLFSCTELIKIDLADGNSNRLVVEGSITNELKIHAVTLSRTGEYFLNQPTKRELNANVSISDGDTLINLFDPEGDGTYETDKEVAGKVGHTYTLDIELSNG
ncbi:MAG: DUF4249 family protein, partial [Bacteroidales bacterium]|nr:DUF4249 family protein [Bacteroidales bacterium]